VDLVQDENDKSIAAGGVLEASRVAYWGPNTGRVNDAVSQALERIFLGDQDVDTAFAQAQEEAQQALDEVQ
jgi:ABC-type glycerol-3-phosphate transport system substrate-binding protein